MMQFLGWSLALSAILCVFYAKLLLPHYKGKYAEESGTEGLSPLILAIGFTVTAAAFAAMFLLGGEGMYLAVNLIVTSLLLIISSVDLSFRKIPNELVFIIVMCPMFFWIYGDRHILEAFTGGVLASILPAAARLLGAQIGSGDIKLMFSAGFYLGTWLALGFFVTTFVLAALMSVLLLIFGKAARKAEIPLAPFAAAAFVFAICFDNFFIKLWRII
ncbi:MAG: prepilin peptidase [Defluviitaleaceae bacterium]|nr:prepilin peptidase [Defluviitaleaceae bacterium]